MHTHSQYHPVYVWYKIIASAENPTTSTGTLPKHLHLGPHACKASGAIKTSTLSLQLETTL